MSPQSNLLTGKVALVTGGSLYAMTKSAIAGLTKGLARDLGPRGITVLNVRRTTKNTGGSQ